MEYKKRVFQRIILVLCSIVLASCAGGGSTNNGDSGGGGITSDTFNNWGKPSYELSIVNSADRYIATIKATMDSVTPNVTYPITIDARKGQGTSLADAMVTPCTIDSAGQSCNVKIEFPTSKYNDGDIKFDLSATASGMDTKYTIYTKTLVTLNHESIETIHGKFVAVGDDGIIITSLDGDIWKKAESSGTDSRLNGVAVNSKGRFIAVAATGEIFFSNSGEDWSKVATENVPLNAVAVDAHGKFVAVGNDGKIFYSSASPQSGITWQAAESSSTSISLKAVAVDKDGDFVAVGDSGTIVTSTDGSHWKQAVFNSTTNFKAITVSKEGKFVAVGNNGTTINSTDKGLIWKNGSNDVLFHQGIDLCGITVSNEGLFVSTKNNFTYFMAYSSSDGENWKQSAGDSYGELSCAITVNNKGKFVTINAVNMQDGGLFTTLDGNNWSDSGGMISFIPITIADYNKSSVIHSLTVFN